MPEVIGNIEGIRQSLIREIEQLYDMEFERKHFCAPEMLSLMAKFTEDTGREIMVYLDRAATVLMVAIGDADRVSLPALRMRRSLERLSGIRCIHTHPGGNPRLSEVDVQSLKKLRMDAMAAVGVTEGKPVGICISVLDELLPGGDCSVLHFGPYAPNKIPHGGIWAEIHAADQRIRPAVSTQVKRDKERVILAAIDPGDGNYDPLVELSGLCQTAGAEVVGSILQKRDKPDGATYLGTGKLRQLTLDVQAWDADAVVFDDELTSTQVRHLEQELGDIKIIDRTALILDIFAQRAATREGRLQVELAQLKYRLPRLFGWGGVLSRLGGGIGTRGPGETRLESDRRTLRRRIFEMEKQIDEISKQRQVRRNVREKNAVPVVALVGYTNAGKSTLLNRISGSSVLAEDKLFATLDTTTRRVDVPGGGSFLLVDTVGFINKLPHDLVSAFRATLEEVVYADLLLHVVDASAKSRIRQREVVMQVLSELGAADKPMITVYNKCDLLIHDYVEEGYDVLVSGASGKGVDQLLQSIAKVLGQTRMRVKAMLPHKAGSMISAVYARGEVIKCEYLSEGILLEARLEKSDAQRIEAQAISFEIV